MDALTENALATMPGPQFLGFYAFLAAAAVFALLFVGAADNGRATSLLPARPDPYQIAFLRDGYGGVVWLAIYALKRAGFVEMNDKGQLRPLDREGYPRDDCEAKVLRAIGQGCAASGLAAGNAAKGVLGSAFDARLRAMEAQGLIRDHALQARVKRLAGWLAVALTLLAGYKLMVAEAHGRHNVGFLMLAWLVTMIVLFIAAQSLGAPKPTPAGRALLARAKLAYSAAPDPKAAPAGFGAEALTLLTVAAVGFSVLTGPDAAFAQQARKNGGGDSGGCSSGSSCSSGGSCGGGGGCGGCGGGD